MKITFVTVSTTAIRELLKAGKNIEQHFPGVLDLKLIYAARKIPDKNRLEMEKDIVSSNAVFVDLMGSPTEVIIGVNSALERCRGQIIPYGQSGRANMRLGKLTADSMPMGKGMEMGESRSMNPAAMRRMADMAEVAAKILPVGPMRDMRNLSQLTKYFRIADAVQMENLLYLLLRDYGGQKKLPEPKEASEIPVIGICDPTTKNYYSRFTEYAAAHGYDKNRPTVALLYYGHTYPDDTSPCIARITEKIKEIANVLPIAFGGTAAENLGQLKEWIMTATGKPVDIILNFMSFRLGAGPMGGDAEGAINVLKEAKAPYLHPFFMTRRSVLEWQESAKGLNSNEFLISVMLPELDGCTEAIPVGAMSEPSLDEKSGIELKDLALIEERADRLMARVESLLKLRKKSNTDKKIAIIGYNYPPGEGNIFGGSFLDTFTSIANILQRLKSEGYSIGELTSEKLREKFTAGKIVNSGRYASDEEAMLKYPLKKYLERMFRIPAKEKLVEQWGDPPGDIMTCENKDFLIPGLISGNIFIGLQPSRGIRENHEKAYHDKELLPHHQYIAFYTWLREEFQADAIIHVGTHGTLEFLKGKECGMSGACFPDRLIADMPHIYLYYAGNPSEAMIAKRRSHANLVGYQPPPFIQGELYGGYVNLSAMIDEYREALRVSPARSEDILKNIRKSSAEQNLPDDLNELEKELYRMNRSLIPRGLHVFGSEYDDQEAQEYIKGLLRYDRGEIKSLRRISAEMEGLDYDGLLESHNTEKLAAVDRRSDTFFDAFFATGSLAGVNSRYRKEVSRTLDYGKSILEVCRNNEEMTGLLRTLKGEYNPARLAGDIFRNPEVLPTGFNLYQFDPRFVPSPTACERGRKIAESTLAQYRKENEDLPSSTAVILWGLETSRTQGETVAQILTYLGVRVDRSSNIWEPRFEIIPLEELERKRVDVVINICGFFRDMFPNITDGLNRIFEQLANLDEPDNMNCFKANTRKIYETLINRGYAEEEARELARSRIFGPGEGQYGAGITGIFETKNWQKEEQIGEEFTRKLCYVYSQNYRGRDVEGLLPENLKSVDIVSQIRSNHEYEITDLDHYYEFFGGLAKSVEMAKGRKARMYITDTTGENIATEGVEKSINRGIRTRLLNPKWIDGMLEHSYHGVQKIAERFENVMGLAATTNSVEEWIYNDMHKTYIEDETLRRRLKENNPHAYMNIVEQMMEYYQRGYWKATQDQIDQLKAVFLELENDIEANLR
jgi:cobaltochelatase CobN